MTVTAQDLIDQARIRHWAFADVALGDGAALLFLNQRQRHLLLRFRDQLRGLVNTTVAQAGVVNGALVGLSALGTPVYLATFADGWAVHSSGGGTPYIDVTEAPVAYDPLGVRGGSGAGWPLPTDAIAIFNLFATLSDGTKAPIDVVNERDQHLSPQGHYLAAYLSGNRLAPCRPPVSAGVGSSAWDAVTGVTLSYLPLQSFTSLTDPVKVPAPIVEPLIANLCELFANHSKLCPVAEKRTYAANARKAEDEVDVLGYDIMGDAQTTSVIYEG